MPLIQFYYQQTETTHIPGYLVMYDVCICMHAWFVSLDLPGHLAIAWRSNPYNNIQPSALLEPTINGLGLRPGHNVVAIDNLRGFCLRRLEVAPRTPKCDFTSATGAIGCTYCKYDAVSSSWSTQQDRPASCVWPER